MWIKLCALSGNIRTYCGKIIIKRLPLTRKTFNKTFVWKMHIILVFTQAVKGFLNAPAKAWCEEHALFIIHKTNL